MNTGRRILKNIFSLTVAEVASKGFALVYTIYLIKKIGPDNNGIFSFAKSLIQYFSIVVLLGFDQIGIREVSKDFKNLSKYVNLITSIRMTFAISSFILLFIIVHIISIFRPMNFEMKSIIFIYSIIILANALMLNWVFQAIEKMEIIAFRTVGIYLLNAIGILTFVKSEHDFSIAVWIIALSTLMNSVWMMFYYIKKYDKINFYFEKQIWFSTIKDSFSIGIIFLIAILYNNIDITMLGIIRSNAETGIYGAGHQIIVFAILPSVILQGAFFSQFASRITFFERDAILSKYAVLQMFTGFAVSGSIFFFPSIIVDILGPKYSGTEIILRFLAITIILQFLISIYMAPLITWKQEKKVIYASIAGLIMNILFNGLLIFKYGMYGSAVATIFCELSVLVGAMIVFKNIHKNIFLKMLFKFIVFTIIGFLPGFILFNIGLNSKSALILSLTIFILIVFISKTIKFSEIKLLLQK
jgi:O-antigen/teichoic acid export membrane protein